MVAPTCFQNCCSTWPILRPRGVARRAVRVMVKLAIVGVLQRGIEFLDGGVELIEQPFPAAVDDCLAAYRALLDEAVARARSGWSHSLPFACLAEGYLLAGRCDEAVRLARQLGFEKVRQVRHQRVFRFGASAAPLKSTSANRIIKPRICIRIGIAPVTPLHLATEWVGRQL